jgi:hypothetical protein
MHRPLGSSTEAPSRNPIKRFARWILANDYPYHVSRIRFFIVLLGIGTPAATYFTVAEARVSYILDQQAIHTTGVVDEVKLAISGRGFSHFCDLNVAASFLAKSDGKRYIVGSSRYAGMRYLTQVGSCNPPITIHKGDPIPVDYAASDPLVNRIVWGASETPDPELVGVTIMLWFLLIVTLIWNRMYTPIKQSAAH